VEVDASYGGIADEILHRIEVEAADLVVMRTHHGAGLEPHALGSISEAVLDNTRVPVLMVRPGAQRMTAIRKLLVPVDGSPGGALAVGTAVGLARAAGAELHFVQVVMPLYMQAGSETLGLSYYDPAWADDAALASARGYVETLVSRLQATGLTVAGEAHMGEIAANIVHVAQAQATDLIVMSTHALTGLPRAVLGSVADDVVRTADCPVLLIHRPVSAQAIKADEFSEVAPATAGTR
jgi:nucleotide-binding universal stress UspA family protein